MEQWQCVSCRRGPSASYRRAPQRHAPAIMSGVSHKLLQPTKPCDGSRMPPAVEGTVTLTEGDLAAGYRDLRGPKAVSWVPPLVVLAIPVLLLVTPGLISWVALAPALL